MNIALLIIATNKYHRFLSPLYESVQKYLFREDAIDVTPFVFTDHRKVPLGCIRIYQKHAPWPESTLKRFHMFERIAPQLKKMDYVFYCDVDMRFVNPVGVEILSKFSATIHPYFFDSPREKLHYEKNKASTAYVPQGMGKRYYMAAFFGGETEGFLKMTRILRKNIDIDLDRQIIAKWHDESHLNCYLASFPPEKELDPGYCYPEGEIIPYQPKILALSKNHAEMRSEAVPFIRRIGAAAFRLAGNFTRKA